MTFGDRPPTKMVLIRAPETLLGLVLGNGQIMQTGAFMSHSDVVKERYVYRQSHKNRFKSQAPRVSHNIDEPV